MSETYHAEHRAYELGATRAQVEVNLGRTSPDYDELSDSEKADILFRVTGYKLDIESEQATDLIEAYFIGYDDYYAGAGI